MKNILRGYFIAILVTALLMGCSINVPLEKVFGTYRVSYPFGKEILTLNRDGSFDQQIAIKDQPPVTVHGKWDYEFFQGSRVNFDGLVTVVDGFGHLKVNWQKMPSGIASFDVEMHWFRIVMGSGAAYPYVKQ
jgi:hypothetical protein